MADVRQVLQPTVAPEHISKLRPEQQHNPAGVQVTDPTKVNQPTNRQMDENQQTEEQTLLMRNFDSNFDGFIRLLKGIPYLSDELADLIFYKTGNMVTSGVKENFTEELTKFMTLMKMSPEELTKFIKDQSSNVGQFQGPLFDKLRTVLQQTRYSPELKSTVGEFLRQYNAYVSRPHIEQNIRNILDKVSDYMMSKPRHEFMEMVKLYKGIDNETQAMSYLKNGIIPFLSKYISRTRDFGQIRNLVNMLTYNAAKIENSSEEQLEDSFVRLMSYKIVRGNMTDDDINTLKNTLIASKYAKDENEFMNSFVKVVQSGVKGDAGIENKEAFRNIMGAMVIDKSVYLPLVHLMIPAEVHGRQFFSEIWVDPDADSFFDGQSASRTVKLLIKFDIKDVGFFESIILSRDDDVAINIYYPEGFAEYEKQIQSTISMIMAKNNLNCKEIGLGVCTRPKDISEVFPKIYEREKIINVTV